MAYSLHDGISDQVFCNSHPREVEALDYWRVIWAYSPEDWEFYVLWRVWWNGNFGVTNVLRLAFEAHYQFTIEQRVNPVTGRMTTVIVLGVPAYWDFLLTFPPYGSADCADYLYPPW